MDQQHRSKDYRQRIYAAYVQARDTPLAPESLAGLKPRLLYLRKLVREHFPQDKNIAILELGCGHGALLHVLSQSGYTHAQGVDGSPQQVAAAQALGIQGVEQGDLMEKLQGLETASLDVVVAFDVIEHFTKSELISLVDEVRRVLKPGGRWIIHTPNAESPFFGRIRYGDFTHEQAFTRISIGQLLMASGFDSVQSFEDRPIPHGLISTIRAALWAWLRICLLFYVVVETGSFERSAVFSQNLLAVAYRDEFGE